MIFSTQPPSSAFGSGPESSFTSSDRISFFVFSVPVLSAPDSLSASVFPEAVSSAACDVSLPAVFSVSFSCSAPACSVCCSPDTAVASAGRLFAHPLTIATAARTGRKAESTCLLPSVFFLIFPSPFPNHLPFTHRTLWQLYRVPDIRRFQAKPPAGYTRQTIVPDQLHFQCQRAFFFHPDLVIYAILLRLSIILSQVILPVKFNLIVLDPRFCICDSQ